MRHLSFAVCGLIMAVSVACSQAHTAQGERAALDTTKHVAEYNDKEAIQLAICEDVLNECAKYGILDENGKKCYAEMQQHPSVTSYIELITECECEEQFPDTMLGNTEWNLYVRFVLEPRGLAE